MRTALGYLVALFCLSGHSVMVSGEQTHIAVAANFTAAAKALGQDFQQQSGHRVKFSFGSTGKLYAQILHGAPFEAFLAADKERPRLLAQQNIGINDSRITYALGQLVLWSTDKNLIDPEARILASDRWQRLAIANPKTAPYGTAAKQVLEKLQLWPGVKKKIVQGESVAQTYQFVVSGAASLGFIAKAQLQRLEDQGSHWPVPQNLYRPIEQQALLLQRGANNPAAVAFMNYLSSEAAQQLIQSHGYHTE